MKSELYILCTTASFVKKILLVLLFLFLMVVPACAGQANSVAVGNAAAITAVNSNAVAVGNVSNADGLIAKTEQEQASNDLRQIGLVVVTLLIIVAIFRFISDSL